MANRGSTWTNDDGLVVGFGTHDVMKTGNATVRDVGGVKLGVVTFDYADINAATAVNVPIPAASRVLSVKLKVHTAFAGAANALIVGDGTDTDGYITTTAGAVANLTAGAEVDMDGVYKQGTTDTTAFEFKTYASADTIDVSSADTDWTAGVASLEVSYV